MIDTDREGRVDNPPTVRPGTLRDHVLTVLREGGPQSTDQIVSNTSLDVKQVNGILYNSEKQHNVAKMPDGSWNITDRGQAILRGETPPRIKKKAKRNGNGKRARSNGQVAVNVGAMFESIGVDDHDEMVVRHLESKKLYRLSSI